MKQKKNAGKHQTGKAGTSRRHHLPRLSAISGLALTASLLSAGISEQARALTFTFEYTYTITANTCTLTSYGADVNKGLDVSVADNVLGDFNVSWGTVTKEQLTAPEKASEKTFGLVMNCEGDIYAPTLKVTSKNGEVNQSGTLYVTDTSNSVAGFAVRAEKDQGATESNVTKDAINNPSTGKILNEAAHQKKMLLTAWPTIMPGKDPENLISGTDIAGTVTINVSYN
ncbi:hypothetical protein DOE63_32750 (plasmid) [Salmonella enterica subsp. diarizonae serovar 59:z10:-]|nr:hypothetical protein DOE63_32750 [Salmonella enterica subsp. diarizonae serovar 59:z10:-]